MEKLTSRDRHSIWNKIYPFTEDFVVPRHGYDYKKNNVIINKLRCAYVILLLQKYGFLDESSSKLPVPSQELISQFPTSHVEFSDTMEEYEHFIDDPDIIWKTLDINDALLCCLLKKTSWRVEIIRDLEDYEYIPKWVIDFCADNISQHIGGIQDSDTDYPIPKCLRSIAPDEYMSGFSLSGNLIVWNRKIENVMKLKGSYPEKAEIYGYLSLPLLNRYYPFLSSSFPRDDSKICFSYLLGDYYESDYGAEGVDLYGLNFEAIIGYLFADIAAEDLLQRIRQTRKE